MRGACVCELLCGARTQCCCTQGMDEKTVATTKYGDEFAAGGSQGRLTSSGAEPVMQGGHASVDSGVACKPDLVVASEVDREAGDG